MSNKKQKIYIPLRDRLILNFMFIGIIIISIVGVFSFYTARKILLDRTFEQMTSVRVVKTRQIESFFADRLRDIKMIVSLKDVNDLLILSNERNIKSDDLKRNAARIYSGYLERYLNALNYYNSFYVINKSGYGIKMITGESDDQDSTQPILINEYPMLEGLVGQVFRSGESTLFDLNTNYPSQGLLIGAPIRNQTDGAGIIVMEISMEAINKIMAENDPSEGLGESGESYLVGEDKLMRSISRFEMNSVLSTKVITYGVDQALNGIDSIAIFQDYRRIPVLSSFSRLNIAGLDWIILAEIDRKEALLPLSAIKNNIIVISSFIGLFLFLGAVFFSDRLTSPIVRLKNATVKVAEGHYDTKLQENIGNEVGDLMHSFNFMAKGLADKTKELSLEREKRIRSVINGQEIERKRLSREIHDGLGQRLIALKLKLENVISADQCETKKMIREVKNSINETIDEVRSISNNLMPAVLFEFGIKTALRNLVEEVAEASEVQSEFRSAGNFDDIDDTTKTYLYRIAQEAINNAIKHAKPTQISVELSQSEKTIRLCIEDNGIGLKSNPGFNNTGNGLYNMSERAELLKGNLTIEEKSTGGTKVVVVVPVNEKISEI